MSTISRTADRPPRLQPLRASARLGLAVMAVLHAAAFIVLWLTEHELFHIALSVLAWVCSIAPGSSSCAVPGCRPRCR